MDVAQISQLIQRVLFAQSDIVGPFFVPLSASVTYLFVLVILRKWVAKTPDGYFDKALRLPLIAHNYLLAFMSLVMVVGIFKAAYDYISKHSLFEAYCGVAGHPEEDTAVVFWAHVFYLTKYYELLDTVFLVLRKRPLSFLHVFHHASVVLMCWYALYSEIVMGWITALNNASVHVIMYYYYAIQAAGAGEVWWKKYITTLQIIQFTIDLATAVFWGYFYFKGIPCRGSIEAWVVANILGMIFFYLFFDFYRRTYTRRASSSRSQHKGTGKGEATSSADKKKKKN